MWGDGRTLNQAFQFRSLSSSPTKMASAKAASAAYDTISSSLYNPPTASAYGAPGDRTNSTSGYANATAPGPAQQIISDYQLLSGNSSTSELWSMFDREDQSSMQRYLSDYSSLWLGSPLNDTTTSMSSLDMEILDENLISEPTASPIRATVPPAEGERTATPQPYDVTETSNLDPWLQYLPFFKRQQGNAASEVATGHQTDNASVRPHDVTNTDPFAVERAAQLHRNTAAVSEATCTWRGQLPPRTHDNPIYSRKVFVGGLPWDITEAGLQAAFSHFGTLKIVWPGKKGHVHLLFEVEESVHSLLQSCAQDLRSGDYFFKMSSCRVRSKKVQIIPWVVEDSFCLRQPSQCIEMSKTIFVGALHGMITAETLGNIMENLFGNVMYAGIDSDKDRYPIGSGRVTFSDKNSYNHAVQAGVIKIITPKFTKTIQVDPHLEDAPCSLCRTCQSDYFCRDQQCYRYFCHRCWNKVHNQDSGIDHHKPLTRNLL